MMRLFGNKVDHPLANAEEAERLLSQLPGQEPSAALDSAAAWYESLAATPEFPPERRLELLLAIDEAVLPHTRRMTREYLTTPGQTRAQEFRLWQTNYQYWSKLAAAYDDSLERGRASEKVLSALRPQWVLLIVRHLNACSNRLKWQQFRYGPVDGALWASAGAAYLDAVRTKVAGISVSLYALGTSTTPEAEYLRMMLLHSSSPDNLLPAEIEVAERLIAHLLPNVSLTDLARLDNVYWVDAAKPLPPTRLARIPEITPTLRFYGASSALGALEKLREHIRAQNALPADVNFGGQYSPRLVLQVIAHLAETWAPKPPMRHHERRRVKSRMTVVGRLDAVCQQLLTGSDDNERAESWVVENVSLGGIGAQVSLVGKDWLRVGVLIAMQPEGGTSWLVGIVRRVGSEPDSTGIVGIETISKSPLGVVADSLGLPTPIVVLDPPQENGKLRVALSIPAWDERKSLVAKMGDKSWRLSPGEEVEVCTGFVVGTFRAKAVA